MPPGRFYPSDCEADDDAEEEASSLSQLFSDSEFERKLANGSRLEDPLFRNQSGTSSDDLPDSSSINNPTLAPQSLSSGTPDYHDSEGGEEGNSASEEVESRAVDSPEDKLPEAPKKAEPAGVAKMEARKLLRTMVDRELGRVQEQVEAALTALQKSPGFKKASEDEQIRMEEELDEESNVCINNLLWLLKQENDIANVNLQLQVSTFEKIGSGDNEEVREISRDKDRCGKYFIPTENLKGYFPEILDEIFDRYVAIMGDSHITDHPIHNENDNKNPDPRTDLSTENLNFSFLLLRKRLEFHGRRADKEWKEFRREIRKEVASAGLREISRQTEPKRWHAETLRISRKMIAEQKRWDKVSGGIRKQEELAYWLVSRECSLVGEPSGFGKDEDEAGNQLNPDSICVIENRKKLPLRKRDRVPKSNHKDLIVSDIQGDDSGDEGARLPKPSSLKRPRRSASPEISHPSAKKLKLPRKKTRSSKEGKRSLRVIKTTNETINDTHEDSPQDTIKPASSPLMRRREIHEIKRLELQAEEIQLQLLEKIQAFKEKHGISHISAADF